MVADEQTFPIQPADAAAMITPRDPTRPSEFVGGKRGGLTGRQGRANRRETIGEGDRRMRLGEKGEFLFDGVNGSRRRRGRSDGVERTAGHENGGGNLSLGYGPQSMPDARP